MYINWYRCSTCIGSLPTIKSRRSFTHAIAALAFPSSVASPQPMTPWLVSIFTKTYGRSARAIFSSSVTPNTFMSVTRIFEPTSLNTSEPGGIAEAGAKAQPQPMPLFRAGAPPKALAAASAPSISRRLIPSPRYIGLRLAHPHRVQSPAGSAEARTPPSRSPGYRTATRHA